ncbi:uncharacterized protein LOC126667646 [Mercurialis annua]|uniref:uncharacterized protein LOC126667646 n=1 Tax=Mercurialis annua TaxID=3986 RepID=UPI00215F1D30|nr:uncharacterized protein LOC126667646 [Mercurialis annua]
MDLEVLGRHALFFDDDALAAFVNSPEALVDWNSLSIDRYDVRHLLSSPPPPRNRRRLNRRSPSPDDGSLEAELDRERYLDLPSSSDNEQGLENEAEVEKPGSYNAVAFSYGAPNESSEQKSINEESTFCPPFPVPEHLLQNLPPTEKVHQIIARTAIFVSKHGAQSEIVLRVKQGDNPTFGFLLPDHDFHPYFRFLVDRQELLKSDVDGKSIESKADGDLNQMGAGALSLLGSVYGCGEDEEGMNEEALTLTKKEIDLEGAVNAENITEPPGSEQKKNSLNVGGKEEALSKPPSASFKDKSHVIKKNRSISLVRNGTAIGVKKDGDTTGSISSASDKLQPSISSSMSKVEPPVVEPPSDLKRVVDKIVEFILRNGKELEAVLVQQDTNHGRFPFLLPSNIYHPYYLKALQKAKEPRMAGKSFTSEKHASLGNGTEKKSGNKEGDTVTSGSDIPYESDRKEKFKMVIGKSKKDDNDPSSKASQSQVGVSVDAAAAILQAATKGIKDPNLEILFKTINGIGQGGNSLLSSRPQSSNQMLDQNKAAAATTKVDSSEASLTREQKLKAERLKRAKMFAAMVKSGAAPAKSETSRGLSLEPSDSGISGSDSQAVQLPGREREGDSAPVEIDTSSEIERAEKKRSADEHNERRSKRSYRSRSKRGEGEGEEEEDDVDEELKEDNNHKLSKKKRRSHHSSRSSRDRHKHRKRHASSRDRESQHRHKNTSAVDDEHQQDQDSFSDNEHRRTRHKHRHDSSSNDEPGHSRRRRRHDNSSPCDEDRQTRRRHKYYGSSDDERTHSSYRRDSSDDEHWQYQDRHKEGRSSDDEDQHRARSVKHRKISRSEREEDLEEGEILTKSDQSKVSDGGEGGSREASVDLSKSSENAQVSDDLRAKIRAMLMATL